MNDVTLKEERFIINKIGLVNFWLYDEEEFDFYDGRLILRGSNASGKSVTMQSFIPLILDGNKSPERLDPFGGKDRKIEDYLIGDADSIQKEESTGYLYMELFKKATNQYLTIGIGLRARKGKGVDFWGFAIKNNQRIGKNLYLYKDKNNKVPLTKLELKSRIGIENEFVESSKDYKVMVNRLLFGFDNLDTYDEFIKLLLQLRSNKLSKDFKPTTLTKILNTVLQPLSEDDLRPLSEAIEEMNKTTEQLENLQKNVKSLNELLKVYNNYNATILFYKSEEYLLKYDEVKTISKEINKLEKNLNEMSLILNQQQLEIVKQNDELELVKNKKHQLDDSNITSKVEELNDLENRVSFNLEKIAFIKTSLEDTNSKLLTKKNELMKNNNTIYEFEKEIKDLVSNLDSEVENNYFNEISLFTEDLLENIKENIDFIPIHISLKKYIDKVILIKKSLDEKDQANIELNSILINHNHLKDEYNCLENNLNSIENNLKTAILEWQENFINIELSNLILKINDDSKKDIFRLMNNYDVKSYDLAKDVYQNEYNIYLSKFKEDFYFLKNKDKVIDDVILSLEKRIMSLKRQNDLEIIYDDDELEQNEFLINNSIPFMPFYKLIEFKDNLDLKTKNYLEAILLDTKIISAKVVNKNDLDKLININKKGLFLFPSTKKTHNLSFYFKAVENNLFTNNYINSILESISLDKNDQFYLTCDGFYNIDFIIGTVTDKYKQKYIGFLKRQEEKQRQLNLLNNELEENIKVKENIQNLIKKALEKENVLYLESLKFPDKDIIDKVIDEKEIIIKDLTWNNKKQKELEKIISEINLKLEIIDKNIKVLATGIIIPLNSAKYEEVISSLNKTTILLNTLDKSHNNYLTKIELNNTLNCIVEEIELNLNNLRDTKSELERDNLKNNNKIKLINELLEKDEYINIKQTLIELEKQLNEIPKIKEQLLIEVTNLQNNINYTNKQKDEKQSHFIKISQELEVYQYIFKKEYELFYVAKDEIKDVYSSAKNIYTELESYKNNLLSNMVDLFYQAYNHYKFELNDYNLANNSLFELNDNDIKLFSDINELTLKDILKSAIRNNLTAVFKGKRLNIIELSNKLDIAINDNKDLISEQDRHLFEDILLDTVGGKIRARISASEVWVLKINNIMREMQQLSSLGLRLRWNSKLALSEDELDTKKLVDLLKVDPKLIKETDASLITNHFRSKLKKAIEINEGNYISYYNIIADVLDYRNWFDFQLLYQKTGEERKELTDKAYSKFSGGERAKATYIPLFASIFAKYYSAKKDAPRIIALDEAFAGVDEVNIREMFGILTSLELDFIVNSQTLWGDYDTIPMLSICELIKPAGSKTVSIERYRWNGKVKEIVKEDENELCELF